MDKILLITLYYDFYGELLTNKQKLVFEMFYQNDLSLSEIGQELSISRQAVRDQLKRTEKILQEYEKTLKLVERFLAQKLSVKKIKDYVEEIEKKETLSDETKNKIDSIKLIADEILN